MAQTLFFEVTDPSGAGRKNYGHNPMPVLIRDIRGCETQFSPMQHSFAAISEDQPEIIDLENVEDVKERYSLGAVNSIVKHVPASEKVVVFDSTIRRASPKEKLCRPVRKVHIDQTPQGVLQRIRKHLSDHEAAEMQAGRLRVRLINVWRPLSGPVVDHPLAVAESLTINDVDLVEVKHVYPEKSVYDLPSIKKTFVPCLMKAALIALSSNVTVTSMGPIRPASILQAMSFPYSLPGVSLSSRNTSPTLRCCI